MTDNVARCMAELRKADYGRYLTVLFADVESRRRLFALYAFDAEIARVRDIVSEPMLGEIRLAWWREAVAAAYAGHPRPHAVIRALSETLVPAGIEIARLDALVDARTRELDEEGFEDLATLEAHAEATSSAVLGIALDLVARGECPVPDGVSEAARHAGIAWTLAGIVRAAQAPAAPRRLLFPRDLVRAEDPAPLGLADGIQTLAKRAREHLRAARSAAPRPPRALLPVLLSATVAEQDLGRASETPRDHPPQRVGASPLGRQVRLYWMAMRGRF